MTSSLFSDFTQRRFVFSYCRFGTAYRSDLKGSWAWSFKMTSIGYSKTSAANYQSTLLNTPEEQTFLSLSVIYSVHLFISLSGLILSLPLNIWDWDVIILVFEKCQVSFSGGISDILAEVLYEFPQNLHTNGGTLTQPGPRQIFSSSFATQHLLILGGADKSLARPGRKQATANKLGIYSTYSPRSSIHFLARCSNFCKPLKKKFRRLSVQPGLRCSNDLRVGRKIATFQLFFSPGNRW